MPGDHTDDAQRGPSPARARSEWRAASTRVGTVDVGRRGLRGPKPGRPVPQGEIHAYIPGDDHTACGVTLDDLHRWDDEPFGRLLHGCTRCQALIRVAPDVIDLTVFDESQPAERELKDADRDR